VDWLARLLSTDPADRARAETAVRDLYTSAGFAEPRHLCWFDSPFAAAWAVALLIEPHHYAWRSLIDAERRSRQGRQAIEAAEAALCRLCGVDSLAAARKEIGAPLASSLQFPPQPTAMLLPKLVSERMALYGNDVTALTTLPADSDPVHRAEQRLWVGSRAVLESGLICHPVGRLVTSSFFNDYSLSRMAHDHAATTGRDVPPLVGACWELADAASVWWPFASGAILAERPSEIHIDENRFLHREDDAAAVYRDGWRVYAWHGLAVPQDWIRHPEAIPPAKLRGFDASFRRFAESRRGKVAASRRDGRSALFTTKLSSDPTERQRALMALAGGKLPMHERYIAGEHTAVWTELVSRGAAVRGDPFAADALAVAYETMSRVERNIRTIVSRLVQLGYEFTTPDGARRKVNNVLVEPDSRTAKRLQRFEKSVGAVPLSLRAFYEVVGSVDLIGRHPRLAPAAGTIAPDPLVIVGIEDAISAIEDDDEGESESALMLAPDDLHKSNVSGGAPYEIGVPDPAADARVLNERHDLLFVDYLRLCFRFGGFPGYEGQTDAPSEIDLLRNGLIEF
jgi:uncharacterized protein DUF6745